MIVSLNPCLNADEYLLTGGRPLTPEELDLIGKARAVLLPQGCRKEVHAVCAAAGPALFPEYGPRFAFPGKVGQDRLFERHGLPHPRTFRWKSAEEFLAAVSAEKPRIHRRPFIVKRNRGHEGSGVFVVEDNASLLRALDGVSPDLDPGGGGFISQDFVPPGGAVLRVVIAGSDAVSYWKRSGSSSDRIVTISRGALVDHMWKPGLQSAGISLSRELSSRTGINLAAVDMVFPLDEPDPAPLLLELNYFFGRRGLGGSENYYRLLLKAAREWISRLGFDPARITLV